MKFLHILCHCYTVGEEIKCCFIFVPYILYIHWHVGGIGYSPKYRLRLMRIFGLEIKIFRIYTS